MLRARQTLGAYRIPRETGLLIPSDKFYKDLMESKIGSLEVNKKADIAIWDRDLYAIPTDQIKELKCLLTLIDGEMVYSSPDSPITTSVR